MDKPQSPARAIILAFLGLIIYIATAALVAGAVAALAALVGRVSFLRGLAAWLLRFIRPDSFLMPVFGYCAASFALRKLAKDRSTAELSCIILGAFLLMIGILFLILNLVLGNSVWINITTAIAGIVFIVYRLGND